MMLEGTEHLKLNKSCWIIE